MNFRITPHRAYEQGILNTSTRSAFVDQLNTQIGTGLRVHKPSDDPVAQQVILTQVTLIDRFDNQKATVAGIRSTLSESNSKLLDAQQLLVQAKDIALQARQSLDPSDTQIFVSELDMILIRLKEIVNSQIAGEPLFAGSGGGAHPFTGVESGSPNYSGSKSAGVIQIPGSLAFNVTEPGDLVFQAPTNGLLNIFSQTGLKTGTGTSVGSQTNELVIQHLATSFHPGSGIQAGSSSSGNDTILGPMGRHSIQINDTSGDGAAGTISLNGGPLVSFTKSDTDLKVVGPTGEFMYVDTTSITNGYVGSVNVAATGTISIRGESTAQILDFTANQTLTSASGKSILRLDTSGVFQTGQAIATAQESQDVFYAVQGLKDLILNSHGLSMSDRQSEFDRSISNLDGAANHLLEVVGRQSVSLKTLDALDEQIASMKLTSQALLSQAGATDYLMVAPQLQEQQSLLQFALYSVMNVQRISLLDYLQ